MNKNIVLKIIKQQNTSITNILGIVVLTIACVLILLAVQIQSNYDYLLTNHINNDSLKQNLIINKNLTNNTLGKTKIDSIEIIDLKKNKFVKSIATIQASQFKASITSKSAQLPFRTDISFESYPTKYLGVKNDEWRWQEGDNLVPIIAPKMFLDMYNFQFAASQGLPQLTPEIVKMILFNITIETNEGLKNFDGRIIELSDNISSLIVPENFMNWANELDKKKPVINKLILETNDATNAEFLDDLQKKGYTTQSENLRFSQYKKVIKLITSTSYATGLILFLFALLIFTLFIKVALLSCKPQMQLLIILGTKAQSILNLVVKKIFSYNLIAIFIAFVIVAITQIIVQKFFVGFDILLPKLISIQTVFAAIILAVVFLIYNIITTKNILKTI